MLTPLPDPLACVVPVMSEPPEPSEPSVPSESPEPATGATCDVPDDFAAFGICAGLTFAAGDALAWRPGDEGSDVGAAVSARVASDLGVGVTGAVVGTVATG